jgi:predicted transcriptional regulator of viral defense system
VKLYKYIQDLASKGRYQFLTREAIEALDASPDAVRAAIRRLRTKGYVATPSRGFHVIVPPEYRVLGCLPAEQFVPQLMTHYGFQYYAGLLTAAQYYGAAHQAPQIFQVVVNKSRAAIQCGRVRLGFIVRHNVDDVTIDSRNTLRGVLQVSSPETTAFDLIGYPRHSGGLSNITTVLDELAEQIDPDKLVAESVHSPLPWAQRLGFLLDLVGKADSANPLAQIISRSATEYVPLSSGRSTSMTERNKRWKLLVNEQVEPDL